MSLLREALRSGKTKAVLAVAAALIAFQVFQEAAAPGKIEHPLPPTRRIDVIVTLPFPPERFHISRFQEFGRVSGADGNAVEVRGVHRDDLKKLARPYWVKRVEPIIKGG